MRTRALSTMLSLCLATILGASTAFASEIQAERLRGDQWDSLAMITGFHAFFHKQAKLEVRLLEADGSASVAEDPIALYLVLTNGATMGRIEQIWSIPRTVARVRTLRPTRCGADVHVEVDRVATNGQVPGVPKILRLCFATPGGELADLQVTEVSR